MVFQTGTRIYNTRRTNEPSLLVKGQMQFGFLFATVILWNFKVIRLQRLGHMECSIAILTSHYLLSFFCDWCQENKLSLCRLCIFPSHSELHVFINVRYLVHVHLLISATVAIEGWIHWRVLMRTAIYVTTDSCLWVFHFISAEISNVNNNNLQVFKG